MNIQLFFRWYDLWIGVYIDTKNRAVYICPIPMIGVKIAINTTRRPTPPTPNLGDDFHDKLKSR